MMFELKNPFVFLCFFIFALVSIHQMTFSQEFFHPYNAPVTDSLNLSSLGFDRILNTYLWTGNFRKEIYGKLWSVDINQRIRSRLIKTDQTAIQDEYEGIIAVRAWLLEKWNLEIKDSSNVLADNRAIDLSRMADHQVLAGFEYNPDGNIVGEAMGGYELNTQDQQNDHGFDYAFGLNAHQVELEEFNTSLQSS